VEAQPQLSPPPDPAPPGAWSTGLPGADAPSPIPEAWSPALAAATVRRLLQQSPVALLGNVVGMGLIAWIYGPTAAPWKLAAWYLPTGVLWLLRWAQWRRHGRQRLDDAQALRQRLPLSALALAQAAMWGWAACLFWGEGGSFEKTALLLMVFTYSLASVQILATQRLLFLPFLGLVSVPTVLRIALDTSYPEHLALAFVVTLLFLATLFVGRTYRGALSDAVTLRLRTQELAAQLTQQMQQAQEARRSAEAANLAKTQFFAAASHDLRQPLHAMGLFAEALRQRSHDPQVLPLVHSINESVDALEGLFAELLDITRIDSGGVEVHLARVPLGELLARIRLHFEPIAFEKGLQLTLRGAQHAAWTDAVLLERILRNLVSNAIRYTHDGGVLVACRVRGRELLLQVWDSGIGIAPEHLARVFDEFYQVQRHGVDQQHRKGLGLGLAIVQRLAALIHTRVEVRSTRGRGSVFSLRVPLGPAASSQPTGARSRQSPSSRVTLQGRRILVVEDEPSVREGLVVLLQGWGAQVQAFDSLAALQQGLQASGFAAPDLVIVDYRLPAGHTGVEALAAVRAASAPHRVPAIVVTGSTMGGHEEEALAQDYHLLIKPVLPNKLRAMIAFKLGAGGG
jgi:two-component system, sensor histidine kinase